jgi:hypothetical protein
MPLLALMLVAYRARHTCPHRHHIWPELMQTSLVPGIGISHTGHIPFTRLSKGLPDEPGASVQSASPSGVREVPGEETEKGLRAQQGQHRGQERRK